MRRALLSLAAITLLACVLAFVQAQGGVRTDEAKYLLSIPYPHPPVFRFLLSQLLWMPHHEGFVRVFLALCTLGGGASLAGSMGKASRRDKRTMLTFAWLLSAPVLLQAGTIMTVIPTALMSLLWLWAYMLEDDTQAQKAPLYGLFWMLSLLTAYQALLMAPVVIAVLQRTTGSRRSFFIYFLVPIALLGLYTITNPLAIASMFNVALQDSDVPLLGKLQSFGIVLLLSGGILTAAGLYGIIKSRSIPLMLSTMLTLSYIALSPAEYYAILLVPLLVSGLLFLPRLRPTTLWLLFMLHVGSSALILTLYVPTLNPSLSRATAAFLNEKNIHGLLLIDGPFGHDWQYENASAIRRYSMTLRSSVEQDAVAIICTKASCDDEIDLEHWEKLPGGPTDVWIKKME